jgi:2'-5' RNA ligase
MKESGAPPVVENEFRRRLQNRYDEMWLAAIARIRAGEIESDPVLSSGSPDRRRGLTVIARPSAAVRRRVAAFLDQLRGIEPDQHYYAGPELHLTVLSLFTATVDHEPLFARTEHYVSAVDAALRTMAPIRIEFRGVTASPGTVMIQGFFTSAALNDLRDALREQLRARSLTQGVDRRYRLETAHMTVVRFRTRLRDGEQFAGALERARERSFGACSIRSFSLVKNDWYMTQPVLEPLKRYRPSRTE